MYIDMVFFGDIIITFLTPISDKEGKLIYDKKKIAKSYFKRWFLIEFLIKGAKYYESSCQ